MKRKIFILLMIAGVLGFAEAAGALVYFLKYSPEARAAVDVTLGVRAAHTNSVLRYLPHPYFNYVGNPDYRDAAGRRVHHTMGIRATSADTSRAAPAETVRIVALGGSTTYGIFAEDPAMIWPELVGRHIAQSGLDVEVINAGLPNYTTFEMIGFAAMWLPELDADIVLLHTGFNDAFAVGFEDEGGADNRHFRHAWSHRPLPRPVRIAMRRSYLLRALGTGWLQRSGHQVGDQTPAIQYPIPPDDEVRRNVAVATGRYFRRNLETLILLCRRAGSEPVLVNMPINPRFEETGHVYYEPVSEAVIRNNGIMAEAAARHGLTLVDLYSRMRDPELYIDAAHVHPDGMVEKARLIYEALDSRQRFTASTDPPPPPGSLR